ncbi:MAG TPA: pyrimidine 5'-nucleotidase [Bacillota bacterium]|nr:pyrimidine 5'-nucleotidase [Bacillota bacterium]
MFSCIICDLDNTLYSSASGMLTAIDRRIDHFMAAKLKISQPEIAELRSEFKQKYGTTLTGLMLHHQVNPDEYFQFAYQIKITDFIGPDPVLGRVIAEINLRKAVFSNSPIEYVEEVLQILKIRQFFEGIYDIRFCDFFGKPNQSSYEKVLDHFQAKSEECLMVDDSPPNLVQARKLGMTPILLSPKPSPEFEWVIAEISELKMLLPVILKRF